MHGLVTASRHEANAWKRRSPFRRATIALWVELNARFDRACPSAVLIAEWFTPKESISALINLDFLRNTLFNTRRGCELATRFPLLQQSA